MVVLAHFAPFKAQAFRLLLAHVHLVELVGVQSFVVCLKSCFMTCAILSLATDLARVVHRNLHALLSILIVFMNNLGEIMMVLLIEQLLLVLFDVPFNLFFILSLS